MAAVTIAAPPRRASVSAGVRQPSAEQGRVKNQLSPARPQVKPRLVERAEHADQVLAMAKRFG